MIQPFVVVLIFIAGAAAGGALAWFFQKSKLQHLEERVRAQINADLIATQERLRAAEYQAGTARQEIEQGREQAEALRTRLSEESRLRATAEARIPRIAELENQVREQDARINTLRQEKSALETQLAEMQARVAEERKATDEKLALLNDAQAKLSDAFKALSAEALKLNNTSFLELAKENLEKFQAAAKGDLETRQKAIDELVKPLRESLETVNKRIGEVEQARTSAYATLTEQICSMMSTQLNCARKRATWSRHYALPSRGAVGARSNCSGWWKWPAWWSTAISCSRNRSIRKRTPDMIISLPNNKNIVVDSRCPRGLSLGPEASDEETKVRSDEGSRPTGAHPCRATGSQSILEPVQPHARICGVVPTR